MHISSQSLFARKAEWPVGYRLRRSVLVFGAVGTLLFCIRLISHNTLLTNDRASLREDSSPSRMAKWARLSSERSSSDRGGLKTPPAQEDGWMLESLVDEAKGTFIKLPGGTVAPIGYAYMNCTEAQEPTNMQRVMSLVSDWEICGFAGKVGRVLGPRDQTAASIDCRAVDDGYGCFIAQRKTSGTDRFANPDVPGMTWTKRSPSEAYLDRTKESGEQLAIRAYLSSTEYKKWLAAISAKNLTGIIILCSRRRLSNALVTAKSIRHGFRSNISIELHWQASNEMDPESWKTIMKAFSPIDGIDITQKWKQMRPKRLDIKNVVLSGFAAKIVSLLCSSFQHTLLMEASQMLLMPPTVLFSNPQYITYGNLFWPSIRQQPTMECAYAKSGLIASEAIKALDAGKGYCCPRDTTTAHLLINKGLHLDVLLYTHALAASRYDDGCPIADIKSNMFSIAFAQASKAHLFSQVFTPPAGVWKRQQGINESKPGWHLVGMLQHDSFVRPTFITGSFSIGSEAEAIELLSSPIPRAWSLRYLESNLLVSDDAFFFMKATDTPAFVRVEKDLLVQDALPFTNSSRGCPLPTFLSLFEMKTHGLSIDGPSEEMVKECSPMLQKLIGAKAFDRLDAKGLVLHPILQVLDPSHLQSSSLSSSTDHKGQDASVGSSSIPALAAYHPHHHSRLDVLQPRDSFPFDGLFMEALRQIYKSHTWLRKNAKQFPALFKPH